MKEVVAATITDIPALLFDVLHHSKLWYMFERYRTSDGDAGLRCLCLNAFTNLSSARRTPVQVKSSSMDTWNALACNSCFMRSASCGGARSPWYLAQSYSLLPITSAERRRPHVHALGAAGTGRALAMAEAASISSNACRTS